VPHDELIKNFKQMRDVQIRSGNLRNNSAFDKSDNHMNNSKNNDSVHEILNSKRDELKIHGTAQSKISANKKVDIKFPEGMSSHEQDYEYNMSNRGSSINQLGSFNSSFHNK